MTTEDLIVSMLYDGLTDIVNSWPGRISRGSCSDQAEYCSLFTNPRNTAMISTDAQ